MPPIKKTEKFRFFFETLKKFRQQKNKNKRRWHKRAVREKARVSNVTTLSLMTGQNIDLFYIFSQGSDILFGDKERFFRALFFFFFFMQLEIFVVLVGRLQFTESSAVYKKVKLKKLLNSSLRFLGRVGYPKIFIAIVIFLQKAFSLNITNRGFDDIGDEE